MNLRRYYNQNRKKIWRMIIIIVSAFILFQVTAYIYRETRKIPEAEQEIPRNKINTNTTTLTSNQSAVTGNSISQTKLKTATTTINEFISYCNKKELQKAYDLLTDECKEQIYNNLETFEQAYYNQVFHGESKNCTIENWNDNIYVIKITDDILATGNSKSEYNKQDYITVKETDKGYKLNISSYIGYTPIDKKTNQDQIEMNVIGKNTYMEKESYIIKISNYTENTMTLDGKSALGSLFLEDRNGVKYSANMQELTDSMLNIKAGETKEITISFYSNYISTKRIQNIVFSDVILKNGQITEKIEIKAGV